ncbi:MAG: tetratricopeptide repeat protein [Bacteroidota bacterium]
MAYTCRTSDLKRSNDLAKKALEISNELKNFSLVAKSLNHLALIAMIRGEHNKSLKFSNEALRLFSDLKDEKGVADARYNLAGVHYKTDNYHLGLVNLIDCLAVYRKYKDYHNQARVQKSLGTIYEYFGDIKNAILSYKEAIAMAKKVNDFNLKSNAYNPLSGIYLKQGKTEKAMAMISRSVELKEQTGDIRGLAFALYGRGKVFMKAGEHDKAVTDFTGALAIHEKMEDRLGTGMTYCKLGALYVQMGLTDKALETLRTGIDFSTRFNIVMVKFKCYYLLYEVYKNLGDIGQALFCLENYFKTKEVVINTQSLKIIESYELLSQMRVLEQEAIKEKEKAEIMEKKNRAEQAAIIKQEFLSTMSHEIRTPLNAVLTIASLLSDKTNDEEKQLIDSLKFAGNNLLLIINDILDFTKLDSGKANLELKPVELKATLNHLKNIYDGLAKEKGLVLKLNIEEKLGGGYNMDQTKLLQILGNLTSNAIKFTDAGEVNITVQRLFTENNKDAIRFSVADTGHGIKPIHKEQIFESFFQPFSITTRRQGGSGLGLAIVKKLVELHGSFISVESEPGKGSRFYFEIVLEKAELLEVEPDIIINNLEGKTVLLAEDNMINAMVVIKLLKGWGIKTIHAKNGLEALEKAKEACFDYILMDIHMPEMDGFVATKQIRESVTENKTTPVFALTADITAEQNVKYAGYFNGFLRKPIEINILRNELMMYKR